MGNGVSVKEALLGSTDSAAEFQLVPVQAPLIKLRCARSLH
jgi:hypothetical protein